MKRYQLSKAGVSATEGIARFNGDKEAYEQMLLDFAQDEHYRRLCEAVANQDAKAAFSEAHSLKGVAGNLSMNRLFEDIFPLVEELRVGSMEHAEERMQKITEDYEAIISAL